MYERPIDVVADAFTCLVDGCPEDAAARLRADYPVAWRTPKPALARRETNSGSATRSTRRARTVSSRTKLDVLVRDGFTCRYSGARLLHPSVLYILSFALDPLCTTDRPHPFGLQTLANGGHPAHYDLFPAIDHVVPVARGGADGIDNLVTASWAANLAKSDHAIDDFENLELLPQPLSTPLWDGLSEDAVTLLERFPGRFDVGRNVTHSRDLMASWRQRKAA